jgi:hypothetical protein
MFSKPISYSQQSVYETVEICENIGVKVAKHC